MSKEEQEGDRRPEVLHSEKWVRVRFGGETIADSRNALLLRAQGRLPVYYFPPADVAMDFLHEEPAGTEVTEQGEGPWPEPPAGTTVYSVRTDETVAENAAWLVQEAPPAHPALSGHVAFAWQAMDSWFEEDDQIRVHPHDPYHLVDVRASSRHVRILLHGEQVVETRRPVLVFETGLPVRYYIPKMDLRLAWLEEGTRTTHCAYKGTAPHYSVRLPDGDLVKNIAWRYPFPNPGYEALQNLVAFYQERIKEFYVDGEKL